MTTEEGSPEPDVSKNSADAALRELKWKELTSRVDAYRFYIQLILGVNGFFYATTGAVVLVYFSNKDNEYLGLFLLLPILMGTVVGGFMLYGTALQAHQQTIIEKIKTELKGLGTEIHPIPDRKLLSQLLWVFGVMFSLVAIAISFVPLIAAHDKRWTRIFVLITGLIIVVLGYRGSRRCINKYKKQIRGKRKRNSPPSPPQITDPRSISLKM